MNRIAKRSAKIMSVIMILVIIGLGILMYVIWKIQIQDGCQKMVQYQVQNFAQAHKVDFIA